jgi:hypothetical protein
MKKGNSMIVERMLVYYDQPLCFVARLPDGRRMLCMLAEDLPEWGRVFLGVSEEQARGVLSGTGDYRALLENPSTEVWRVGLPWKGEAEIAPVERPLPEKWLPEAGLFLEPSDGEGFEPGKELDAY